MQRLSPITLLWRLRDALLAIISGPSRGVRSPPDLLEATKRAWAADARLRIEPDAEMRIDRDGTWVAAWVLAGDIEPIDRDALFAARRSLPLFAREVYCLLSDERLTYRQIAVRLGISVAEVRQYATTAMRLLDAAIGPD